MDDSRRLPVRNVRIVASGLPYRSAFVTVSTAASIMGSFSRFRGVPQDA